ncbi:uncharacterized protein ACIBXB_008861 [Morphnus guianensis]
MGCRGYQGYRAGGPGPTGLWDGVPGPLGLQGRFPGLPGLLDGVPGPPELWGRGSRATRAMGWGPRATRATGQVPRATRAMGWGPRATSCGQGCRWVPRRWDKAPRATGAAGPGVRRLRGDGGGEAVPGRQRRRRKNREEGGREEAGAQRGGAGVMPAGWGPTSRDGQRPHGAGDPHPGPVPTCRRPPCPATLPPDRGFLFSPALSTCASSRPRLTSCCPRPAARHPAPPPLPPKGAPPPPPRSPSLGMGHPAWPHASMGGVQAPPPQSGIPGPCSGDGEFPTMHWGDPRDRRGGGRAGWGGSRQPAAPLGPWLSWGCKSSMAQPGPPQGSPAPGCGVWVGGPLGPHTGGAGRAPRGAGLRGVGGPTASAQGLGQVGTPGGGVSWGGSHAGGRVPWGMEGSGDPLGGVGYGVGRVGVP